MDARSRLPAWLRPSVDPHPTSFLGRGFAGMPGPVWSLAAWDLAMFCLKLLAVVSIVRRDEVLNGLGWMVAFWGVSALVVLLLGRRLTAWSLHLMVALNIMMTCVAAVLVPNDVRAISNLMLLPIAAVYVATWFSRRQMWAYLVFITGASLAVLVVHGIGATVDLTAMWIVVTVSSIGIAVFINILVSHLSEQATIDPLTGLQNRAGLAGVADEYSRRGGGGQPRTVVVIDLDGFKVVNDQFGHEAGDEVLRQVAAAMRLHLRPYDVISRVGGDEFVLLLMRTAVDQSERVVDRLIQALPIAASYGLADWPDGSGVDEAMARADVAMYESKAARRLDPGQEPVGSS